MKNKLNIYPGMNGTNNFMNLKKRTFWEKWHALEDTQAKRKTMWFTLSLIVQGIFLSIPVYLIFYDHAPVFLGMNIIVI